MSLPRIPPPEFLERMCHTWQYPFKICVWNQLNDDQKNDFFKFNEL